MAEYVLVQGRDVAQVIRKSHHDDDTYWLVKFLDADAGDRLGFTRAEWCEPLDPALNILFERKEDDDKTGDSRRTG